MIFIEHPIGFRLRTTDDPEAAFLSFRKGVYVPCYDQEIVRIKDDFYGCTRSAFSTMHYFGSKDIFEAEVKMI